MDWRGKVLAAASRLWWPYPDDVLPTPQGLCYTLQVASALLTPRGRVADQLRHIDQLYRHNQLATTAQQVGRSCLSDLVMYLSCSSSNSAEVQCAAARALGDLAGQSADISQLIGQTPGAVAGLVRLLGPGRSSTSHYVTSAAAYALVDLAWANRDRIAAEPGAIKFLTAMLSSKNAVEQDAAAVVLLNLVHGGSLATRERIGGQPGAITHLVAMLSSSMWCALQAAICTLGYLALESPVNSKRISQEPGVVATLVALLSSRDAPVQQGAAWVIVSAAEGADEFAQVLQGPHSAAVWLALSDEHACLEARSATDPTHVREIACLLHRLAAGSNGLKRAMSGSQQLKQLLKTLAQHLGDTPDNAATAVLKLLTDGADATAASPAAAPSPLGPAQNAGHYDQWNITNQTYSRPHNNLATAGELLKTLNSVSKAVPMVGGVLEPLTMFMDKVDQVRVNKAKALSMKKRVEALMEFLVCMFSAKELRQSELAKAAPEQLKVLQLHLKRLHEALKKAVALVTKWSKPMLLDIAVRFLKCSLDKEDIKDFENTVNKAVQDLGTVLSGLNLIRTMEMQQQVLLLVSKARDSDAKLEQQLKQDHQQDLQQLQGQLDQLLGGKRELQHQLAAATEEQRQEWATVAGRIDQVLDVVQGIQRDVRGLEDAMRGLMVNQRRNDQDSSSGPLLSSRLMLDRGQVHWDASQGVLGEGGFAIVYHGTLDHEPVAIKLLRLSAFNRDEREQMYDEAVVLSRLNHPCIVRFWGVVPVEEGRPQGVPQRGFASNPQDTAHVQGGRGWAAPRSIPKQLSLGLVLDLCDYSLEDMLHATPLLPLVDALHIAERIACGLKYLHSEAPLNVVHGDLKPANVLLKAATRAVQLTDFGLSSTIAVHSSRMQVQNVQVGRSAAGQSAMQSAVRSAGGTVWWAAPELLEAWALQRFARHTFACDMYAFGLILYQLLVGRQPYANTLHEDAVKSAVRGGQRPSWGDWEKVRGGEAGRDVLQQLRALAEACWAHSAKERPSARQVHTQLVELKGKVAAVPLP